MRWMVRVGTKRMWEVECDCGAVLIRPGYMIRNRRLLSCGCAARRYVVGDVLGSRTIIGIAHRITNHRLIYVCECACGREISVEAVRISRMTDCGCGTEARTKAANERRKVASAERHKTEEYKARIKFQACKHRAKNRGREFDLTQKSFNELILSECRYCAKPKAGGVDRIDSNIGYVEANCAPCCSTCNYMKRMMTHEEFCDQVLAIAERLTDLMMAQTREIARASLRDTTMQKRKTGRPLRAVSR